MSQPFSMYIDIYVRREGSIPMEIHGTDATIGRDK